MKRGREKQFNLFSTGELELKAPKKLRWQNDGGIFWRSFVKKTGEGHTCRKCEHPIKLGEPASLSIDTDKPKKKLEAEDFKNIKYWHYKLNCPEIVEDEPL